MTNTTNNNATVNELYVAHNVLDAITEEALLQDRPKVITNMASQTINATTTIKEEETMKKRTIAIVGVETQECVETTLDALSFEELLDMKQLTKDIIRAYLEEENVVMSNTEFKKTKRGDLLQMLYVIMHPVKITSKVLVQEMTMGATFATSTCRCTRCGGSGIFYTRVENNIPVKAIPDDGMCYRCQGTGIEPGKELDISKPTPKTVPVGDFSSDTAPVFEPVPKKERTAKEKSDLLKEYLKDCASKNAKKGFGYSISAHMLCAIILKADCGLEKLKGNEDKVTDEQKKSVDTVRTWLKEKGIITPVLYTVEQDENVRVYIAGYDGRKDNTENDKVKIYPYNQHYASIYKPVSVTSYAVNLNNWK